MAGEGVHGLRLRGTIPLDLLGADQEIALLDAERGRDGLVRLAARELARLLGTAIVAGWPLLGRALVDAVENAVLVLVLIPGTTSFVDRVATLGVWTQISDVRDAVMIVVHRSGPSGECRSPNQEKERR